MTGRLSVDDVLSKLYSDYERLINRWEQIFDESDTEIAKKYAIEAIEKVNFPKQNTVLISDDSMRNDAIFEDGGWFINMVIEKMKPVKRLNLGRQYKEPDGPYEVAVFLFESNNFLVLVLQFNDYQTTFYFIHKK